MVDAHARPQALALVPLRYPCANPVAFPFDLDRRLGFGLKVLDANAFRAVLGDPTDHLARISSKSLHGRPISFDDVVGAVRFLISSDGAMVQGQTLVGSHGPTSMAALTKTERLESLHRNDRSTITPPTPTSRTQIRPGTHGASRHTITPNLSTLNLT